MGRLPLVDPGDVGASSLAREALAAAWAARGRSADPNVYRALASHPRALRKLVEFGTVANFDNSMTPGAARDWLRDGALTDAGRASQGRYRGSHRRRGAGDRRRAGRSAGRGVRPAGR